MDDVTTSVNEILPGGRWLFAWAGPLGIKNLFQFKHANHTSTTEIASNDLPLSAGKLQELEFMRLCAVWAMNNYPVDLPPYTGNAQAWVEYTDKAVVAARWMLRAKVRMFSGL